MSLTSNWSGIGTARRDAMAREHIGTSGCLIAHNPGKYGILRTPMIYVVDIVPNIWPRADLSDMRAAFPPPWGGRVGMAVVIVRTVVGRPPTAPVIRAYEIVNILHSL